jgi:two-component system LytT family response regulator
MLKAIIIEDNHDDRNALRNLLTEFNSEIRLCGEADGVVSGLGLIRAENPNLVFLDIQLADGDGFDLLQRTQDRYFKVIIVTAYDEYAIRAIKFSALDFLLKPVDPTQFKDAIAKVLKDKHDTFLQQKIKALLTNINDFQKIALPSLSTIRFVAIESIMHCKAEANYTWFHFRDQEKILVSKNLKEYDEMLEPFGFFRVHQSHLVNLRFVKEYKKTDGGIVVMEDGQEIYVARRRKELLLAMLMK